MIFFRSKKDKQIEQLLSESRQNFEFDSQNIKARLMMAVESQHFSKEELRNFTFKPNFWPRYAFSLTLAVMLMVGTTGFAFAANNATPGDVLFPIQKIQNQIVLSLPLPETKKEEIRTEIVTKRLKELDAIEKISNPDSAKIQAIVKESQASIDDAVTNLHMEPAVEGTTSPDKKQAKLDNLATKLDGLIDTHQKYLKNIQEKTKDSETKETIDNSAKSIESTREKLNSVRKNRAEKSSRKNSDKKQVKETDKLPQTEDKKTSGSHKTIPEARTNPFKQLLEQKTR
jgi:hypothetical protein